MINLVKLIENTGVFTGSRYWGVETKNSDYDYFFNIENYTYVMSIIKKHDLKYEPSRYKEGVYVNIYNKKYNLFLLNSTEYQAWRLANDSMVAIAKGEMNALIRNRNVRVDLFETLCTFYKTNRNQGKFEDYCKKDEIDTSDVCHRCKHIKLRLFKTSKNFIDYCKKYKIDINNSKRSKQCIDENGKVLICIKH